MSSNNQRLKPGILLIIISGFVFAGLYLFNCAGIRPQSSVSQYQFRFKDDTFRIRSIFNTENDERYNELIGKSFLAVDFDQDRIIDRIAFGNVSLAEAQEVYDYGLNMLTKENRLRELNPTNHKYTEERADLDLEIKSFYPENGKPFNQLKIISKKQVVSPEFVVAIDYEADGKIDEILKGTIDLEKVQKYYSDLIESGLSKNELVKMDRMILVKK